ncbi:MAG TPA: DUF1801 domain-containing protein [Candidatus Krumholzibacteria bacterium]|nr:DUF1801 domain-containing protein [Candidatus Krumholzibacteria bacterium]
MATRKPSSTGKSPDELAEALNQSQLKNYLDAQPSDARKFLQKLRDLIRSAARGATDSFGYGTPEIRMKGETLFRYEAMQRHVKLSPIPAAIDRAELKGLRATKDAIQLPYSKPLPVDILNKLVKARIAELGK